MHLYHYVRVITCVQRSTFVCCITIVNSCTTDITTQMCNRSVVKLDVPLTMGTSTISSDTV